MARHLCHARGCAEPVPPKMFMCKHHWFMCPAVLRAQLWAAYVEGQEIRKDPTREYLRISQACIDAVAEKERFSRGA